MPAGRFFALAQRLVAYSGAVRMRRQIEAEMEAGNVTRLPATTPTRTTQVIVNGRPDWAQGARSVERTDDGRWLVDGCAYDADGVPSWVRRNNPAYRGAVDVVPAQPAAMAFSPSFAGQFSYAKVSAGDDERGGQ